jgi:hypothetical protein
MFAASESPGRSLRCVLQLLCKQGPAHFSCRRAGVGLAGGCSLQRRCCRITCSASCPSPTRVPLLLTFCTPWLRCLQDRVRIEAKALAAEARYCPAHVPAVYCFDPQMCIIAMQASQQQGRQAGRQADCWLACLAVCICWPGGGHTGWLAGGGHTG